MAELNLVLKYKFLPARIMFIIMMATLPIWEVGAPIGLGYLIRSVLWGSSIPFSVVSTAIPGLILLIAFCIALTGCAEDNRIHLSKEGFSFPPFLLPSLKFRRAKQWIELQSASLLSSTNSDRKVLQLCFADSAPLKLELGSFSKNDIEQLLLAIELWGTNCKRSDELISYQNQLQGNLEKGELGYTQIWEEELNRRFQATSFVPLEPGQKLQSGRIEIVRQLAFGGLSAIYLAQENQGQLVVIKEAVVPSKADAEMRAEAEKHLLREAELLAKFQHEQAARVLDHFMDGGRHYLKLEYINGTDLRQYVKQNGKVPEPKVIDWALQILEVLQAMHMQNPPILHRDLTPENLVLAKDRIVLIDFGAANEFVGTATGTIVGKQSYMPAEQLRGKSSAASDIYALACSLYYFLCGKDPLPLSVARPKETVSEISSELDEIIAKCTAFEPEDRYQSCADLVSELEKLRSHTLEKEPLVTLQENG